MDYRMEGSSLVLLPDLKRPGEGGTTLAVFTSPHLFSPPFLWWWYGDFGYASNLGDKGLSVVMGSMCLFAFVTTLWAVWGIGVGSRWCEDGRKESAHPQG